MKKIGLYGGTFDPIHLGHMNLASELMKKKGLDEVWFIPAKINPHKSHLHVTSFEHRVRMLQLALQEIPQFKINQIEKDLPSPSYTIHTLQAIFDEAKKKNYEHEYYLLLGEDVIPSFPQWYRAGEIIKLIPLLIGTREGSLSLKEDKSEDFLAIKRAIEEGMVATSIMDISSVNVRDRISSHLCCDHLVPIKVLDYALKNQLY